MSLWCNQAEVTVTSTGDLRISVDHEARAEIAEWEFKNDCNRLLSELTERYWTNGSFEPFCAGDANPFVGLTEAPCVAESMDVDDGGNRTIVGRLWYMPNYMVRLISDDLIEFGETTLKLAN